MARRMSIAEARRSLPKLPEKLARTRSVVRVTQSGKPVLAILSWQDYDGLCETLEMLSDQKLMASLRRGMREVKEGKTVPWQDVKHRLGL